ncbi:MAG: Txe/YoeB family addiction module toxin [Erysipelotrichaceae bacterium]|nr:Txe/YoeB family addiction module toxin [Erysipelotrichaceae bacterium]
MKNKIFTDSAWLDYLYWENQDRKTLKRINQLIEDIDRNGNSGIGRPEPLLGDLSGFFSRRIDIKNRLIYTCDSDNIYIVACRSHYDDR